MSSKTPGSPPSKRKKNELSTNSGKDVISLEQFEFVEVLSQDPRAKIIRIKARCLATDTLSVIIFEKPHFESDSISSLFSGGSRLVPRLQNDVYNDFDCHVEVENGEY